MPSSKPTQRPGGGRWSLETAKARFSEVVRTAHVEGPQHVTVRGRDSVVIISREDYDRLTSPKATEPLVDFLEGLDLHAIDTGREEDRGRDVEL